MMYLLCSFPISISSPLLLIPIFILAFLLKTYYGKSPRNPNYPPISFVEYYHEVFNFKRLHDCHTETSKKHPTFRIIVGLNKSSVFTSNPKNVEHILKTNFGNYPKGDFHGDILSDFLGQGIFAVDGEKWKQQRKLTSFEFSTRVLRDFSCTIFRQNTIKLVKIISAFSETNHGFNINDLFMRFAWDSILQFGLGVDVNSLEGPSKEWDQFMYAFDNANELIYRRYVDPFWKLKRLLSVGSEFALRKNIETLHKFVRELINLKKRILAEQHIVKVKEDILSRFLEASIKDPQQINDQYVRDAIINFIIAGKDTTANVVSWFIYALCKNPIVQEKLFEEVSEVFSGTIELNDIDLFVDQITDERLDKMHYLHAALNETLRLYPAIALDAKSAMEDDVLPDGYRVRKGDDVYYLAYAMGRMQRIWGHDAEEYRPERWLDNGVFRPESPFKFVAFHAGPRVCLGKNFAYRQMKIISVALLYFFRFQLADEKKRVTYRMMLNLHLCGGLHVIAKPRIKPEALKFGVEY